MPVLLVGRADLTIAQAHHLRDVLRLTAGDVLEAFDDAGVTATATLLAVTADKVTIEIQRLSPSRPARFSWTVAAAVPKGQRADWMVEKLAELGAAAFIPLMTARSVSVPAGTEKPQRWARLAAEAARQSGRAGAMRIDPVTPLAQLLARKEPGQVCWYLSTRPDAVPIAHLSASLPASLLMLIGPEGGWTDQEIALFDASGLKAVKLTQTILRVETAALAAGAVVATGGNYEL